MLRLGLWLLLFGGSSDLPGDALKYFANKKVFILGDYDKAGAKRVKAYDALLPIAKDVRHAWLQEPQQSEVINDATDWFSHGGTVDKLKAQVKVAKEYQALPKKLTNRILTYNDILDMPPPKWLVYDYYLRTQPRC